MTMKAIMKTMKRNSLTIVMAVAFALPAMAQFQPKDQYAAAPISFQSTSVMTGSGSSYCSNPMLNADGTATYNGGSTPSGGPNRAKKDGDPFGGQTIVDHDINDVDTPIGDALLPLMLLALAYLSTRVFLKRKRALKD